MKNWKIVGCALLLVICGCASSTSVHQSRAWRQSGHHAHLYNNGSHPQLGKLPPTDVPLVVNDAVMKWINYFTATPGSRDRFARYLQRSGRYVDMMRHALRQRGMPEDLVYVALIESGFRNDAQSWASAVGTWQFIRGTARGYGLNIDSYVDERRDPEKAVDAAARYLKNLHDEFGDWYLAMAGYNAGEGRVRQAIARYGTKNFWELAAMGNGAFRPETRDYVPKYIAATIIAKNPKRFGFSHIDYHDPLNYDTAQIKGQADLMAVADAANVPVDVIQELNPELYAGITPPGQYMVRLPIGTARHFKREFPRVAKNYRVTTRSMMAYRVRRGDSLGGIARRYGMTARQLMATNNLRSARLRAGQMLRIPSSTKQASHSQVVAVAESTGPMAPASLDRSPNSAATTVSFGGTATTTYTIRPGDRLSTIARNYGVTISDLRRWNKLRGRSLQVGQMLRIKAPVEMTAGTELAVLPTTAIPPAQPRVMPTAAVATPAVAKAAPVAPSVYRVRRGDVLSTIARRHGVTVRDLQAWNGIRGNRIQVGQQLRVKGAAAQPVNRTVAAATTAPRTMHTYRVQRGDSLFVIAKRYGVDVDTLRAWNGLAGNRLKVGQQLMIQGKSVPGTVIAKADSPTASSDKGLVHYRVRTGDTVGEIAQRNNMTTTELRRLNQLSTRSVIRAGQTLKIRAEANAMAQSMPASPPTPREPVAVSAKSLWSDRVSLSANSPKQASREVIYQVKPGDTLWDISKTYEVSPEDIQNWNNLSQPNLKPGQKLTIRITS